MSVITTDRRISSNTDRRERGDGTPQSDDSAHEEARLRDRVHDHVRRDLHLWVMSLVSDSEGWKYEMTPTTMYPANRTDKQVANSVSLRLRSS